MCAAIKTGDDLDDGNFYGPHSVYAEYIGTLLFTLESL